MSWTSSHEEHKNANHELLITHYHPSLACSGKPGTLKDIGDAVKAQMQEWQEEETSIRQFWFEDEINQLCGGWAELLVAAVHEHPELELKQIGPQGRWFVIYPGLVSQPRGGQEVDDMGEAESLEGSSLESMSEPNIFENDSWELPSKGEGTGWEVSGRQPTGPQEKWDASNYSEQQDNTGWGQTNNDLKEWSS